MARVVAYSASPRNAQARAYPCLYPGLLGDCGNHQAIPVFRVPAGADLQRNRYIHRIDNSIKYATDQGLITQQRGSGHDIADLFGRTAHVDIDDLCALIDIESCCSCHLHGIGSGNLYSDWCDLAGMVDTAAGLAAAPEQRIG